MEQFVHTKRPEDVLEVCPITGLPFFMMIEHHDGLVPTYGGPYDSYTIPQQHDDPNDGYWWDCYDHDRGCWVDWKSGTLDIFPIDKVLTEYVDDLNVGDDTDRLYYLARVIPKDRQELEELMKMAIAFKRNAPHMAKDGLFAHLEEKRKARLAKAEAGVK